MGVMAVFTTAAPASTAAAAQATAIRRPSLSSTPRATPPRAGTSSSRPPMNPPHSAGVMIPAESHRVMAEAPASTAAEST